MVMVVQVALVKVVLPIDLLKVGLESTDRPSIESNCYMSMLKCQISVRCIWSGHQPTLNSEAATRFGRRGKREGTTSGFSRYQILVDIFNFFNASFNNKRFRGVVGCRFRPDHQIHESQD